MPVGQVIYYTEKLVSLKIHEREVNRHTAYYDANIETKCIVRVSDWYILLMCMVHFT